MVGEKISQRQAKEARNKKRRRRMKFVYHAATRFYMGLAECGNTHVIMSLARARIEDWSRGATNMSILP
jgi:hypothetical protein